LFEYSLEAAEYFEQAQNDKIQSLGEYNYNSNYHVDFFLTRVEKVIYLFSGKFK